MLQAVLLYGTEICFVAESMIEVLEVFHHSIYWSITRKTEQRVREEVWEWTPVEKAQEAA